MKKVLNTDINKLNWRFNQIFFSDHKPGHLLYGIMEPITINPCGFVAADKQKSPEPGTSKLIYYILLDSMLNQMDGTRLSKKYDATVDCRFDASIIAVKPDNILLHVGT